MKPIDLKELLIDAFDHAEKKHRTRIGEKAYKKELKERYPEAYEKGCAEEREEIAKKTERNTQSRRDIKNHRTEHHHSGITLDEKNPDDGSDDCGHQINMLVCYHSTVFKKSTQYAVRKASDET